VRSNDTSTLSETPSAIDPPAPPPPSSKRSRERIYVFLGIIAVAAVASALVFAFLVPLSSGVSIPLSYNYEVGEHMTYNMTSNVSQFEQSTPGNPVGTPVVQNITETISMDVLSFDGENYTINETASIPLASLPVSFTIMGKINKTGYVTILSGPFAELNSAFTGLNLLSTFFQKEQAKVGETWHFPISELGNLSFGMRGNITFTFGNIQSITVPAGTYKVFSIDVSASNLTMNLNIAGISYSASESGSGQEYLEYGTCRQIESNFQENVSYQIGGQNYTTNASMQMELVQDIKH
jgi:hypothetical protein